MATETASISIGVTFGTTSKKGGSATAQIVAGALEQPQPYSGGTGIAQSASSATQKLQMPSTQTIGWIDGKPVTVDANWWRFIHDFFERMGGPQGVSIRDLSSTVVDTRAQAITAQNGVAAVAQQANANAQALGAVVQVTQNNSLAGSSQIPPVVYSSKPGQLQR